MNILYLDHYAGSFKHGRSFRPYYLGKEWVKAGHKLTVVGGSYSHVRSTQPDQLGLEDIEGIQYLWLRTPGYPGNGLKRFWSMLVFIFQLFWNLRHIIKLSKPDVVIASTVYMLDIFPAWVIKKLTGARLVFELHDIWPASPVELGPMSPYHPFILLLAMTEVFTYRVSDRVVSILPKTYDHMKQFGVKESNFLHIPNGIDLADWEQSEPLPEKQETFLTELKASGYFLICYAGSHAISNSLTTLLDAADILKEEKIHFILIGDGQEKQNLQAYAQHKSLNQVTFMDRIPKRSIPTALGMMDVLAFHPINYLII
jgi:glycosyltransferase involved in cell wall biosynthesis